MNKALILSAGFGKRLLPLTKNCPKPLLKIGQETLLSNTINFLKKCGIKEVVLNVHYLREKIIEYVNKKKFDLKINIIEEKEKILDTGGGILNALNHFSESFLCINPDTVWDSNYIEQLNQMKSDFVLNKRKCLMLVVHKSRSFDKSFKGDFNLKNGLVDRNKSADLNYVYTGLQIIKPELFSNIKESVFSVNQIWDKLIAQNELYGIESKTDFLHVTDLNIYKNLNIK